MELLQEEFDQEFVCDNTVRNAISNTKTRKKNSREVIKKRI
jgi:hypothetical protein